MQTSITDCKLAGRCLSQSLRSFLSVMAMLFGGVNPTITLGSEILLPTDSVKDLNYWVSASTVIVRGTVVASEGVRGGRPLVPIWTEVRFRVTDLIKGSLSDSLLIFDVPGGTVGDITDRVFDSGIFPRTIGEEAILFLTPKPGGDVFFSPRGLALEAHPLQGGVVVVQRNRIVDGLRLIPAEDYVNYLRALSSGEKVPLDSFLQSLPSSEPTGPTVDSSHPGGAVPVDQIRRFDKPKTLAPLPSGYEQVPTEGIPAGAIQRGTPAEPDTGNTPRAEKSGVPSKKQSKKFAPASALTLTATIYNAWWSNQFDNDGDGCVQYAKLNWDPDVAGGFGSLQVYEEVYYKQSTSEYWSWFATTQSHTITDLSTLDAQYVNVTGGSHGLWDWLILIYRVGQVSPDDGLDPSLDFDLDNVPMETPAQDVITAIVYTAWWTDEIDYDGDGYVRYALLKWDPDVAEGPGSANVFEKIFWKLSTSGTWNPFTTTTSHTITAQSLDDQQQVGIIGLDHHLCDWRIEVYRVGQGNYDDYEDESNNSYLDNKPMESASQDAVTPVITSIVPDHQPAGTDDPVTIYGTGFEAIKGSGQVLFRTRGTMTIPASTFFTWNNYEISCTVPAIAGYSAHSGPVVVLNASGRYNDPGYNYTVAFGYGQQQWPYHAVDFYINDNTTDCIGEDLAIRTAASTWNEQCADFAFLYAGKRTDTDTGNGINEIWWVPSLPGGVAAYTWSRAASELTWEADILINDSYTWSTSGSPQQSEADVRTYALHEFGHWLTLEDLYGNVDGQNDVAKVMYYTNPSGTTKRTLHPDDIAGIRWIYGMNASACDCAADPKCDGLLSDILDVVEVVESAFRNFIPPSDEDEGCPCKRRDVDCSGAVDVLDVVKVVGVAFRNVSQNVDYCLTPCTGCGELPGNSVPIVMLRELGGQE